MTPSSPLTCRQVVEMLTDYLEGALAPSTAAALEEHLATCPGCSTYLAQISHTVRLLGAVTPDELPESTQKGLVAAFRGLRPPRP
ncbi:anti-sigma factor RsiW [Arthrobacter silviterrae]|uniref:Anti-sigma factor n=1 Tax=Arthrobacter silviterrae TaxID=2026658 RepID=A0ABX0DBP2_9MICC|nr:zf-HC2 domain-containing protein [Arthrobacter silviterrae]MDQ0276024.1 anti-sigma factor RsiW [Arthrobacter silviterrae]NGN84343.1 anti-sigma factor [Arthrobacter silviterrae]